MPREHTFQDSIDETREVCERNSRERDQRNARAEFDEFAEAFVELGAGLKILGIPALTERFEIIRNYISSI